MRMLIIPKRMKNLPTNLFDLALRLENIDMLKDRYVNDPDLHTIIDNVKDEISDAYHFERFKELFETTKGLRIIED